MLRVEVRWLDSGLWREAGWESLDKITSEAVLSEVSTVGWLAHEDDFSYYICSSWDPANDAFNGTQVIAKQTVTGFTRLRARGNAGAAEEEDESPPNSGNPEVRMGSSVRSHQPPIPVGGNNREDT